MKRTDMIRPFKGRLLGLMATCALMLGLTATVQAQETLTHFVNDGNMGSVILPATNPATNLVGSTTVSATANPGYEFTSWQVLAGDMLVAQPNSTSTVVAFNTPGDTYWLQANFEPLTYLLVVSSSDLALGTVDWDPLKLGNLYTNNAVVTLTATALAGGQFVEWSGDLSGTNPVTTVTMDSDKTISARFAGVGDVTLTVTSRDSGDVSAGAPTVNGVPFEGGPVTRPFGEAIRAAVTSPYETAVQRGIVSGYTGTGSAPSGLGADTGFWMIEQTSTVTWNWGTEYLLQIEASGLGDVNRSPAGTANDLAAPTGYWYPEGAVVTLEALEQGENFLNWGGDISGVFSTNVVVMSGPKTVQAIFGPSGLDQDKDGLPDEWEARFGLDSRPGSGAEGDNGTYGDADNDQLSNLEEYLISNVVITNGAAFEASPINADSDGDGIHDGYEYAHFPIASGTNTGARLPGEQENARAVVSIQGVNGRLGNVDQDFLWNTLTGYRREVGLDNWMEYRGPDNQSPGIWEPAVPSASIGLLPGFDVYRYQPNTNDTIDSSFTDTTDSETVGGEIQGDGFDDGFEYTWDQWQAGNGGTAVGDPLKHRVPYLPGIKEAANPVFAAYGELDYDGFNFADVVVANFGQDRLDILKGNGAGTFSLHTFVDVSEGPRCLALTDLDADNINDILVVSGAADELMVLTNSVDGQYVASYTIDLGGGANPSFVEVGHFNNDGWIDVAVANEGTSTVDIFFNDAGSGLMPAVSVAVPAGPTCLDAGVMLTNAANAVQLMVTSGGGDSFSLIGFSTSDVPTIVTTVALPAGAQPQCIVIDDFNNDGVNDVTVSMFGRDAVQSYMGDGVGNFDTSSSPFTFPGGSGIGHFAAGDFDSEITTLTHRDLAVVSSLWNPGQVSILSGTGSDLWTLAKRYDVRMQPNWILVEDVDGDGDDDLLVLEGEADSLLVMKGYGNGTFQAFGRFDTSAVVTDRRFNPAQVHAQEPDFGMRDYDLVYNTNTSGVGEWLYDTLEYNAWSGSNNVPAIIRKEYPDRPRSTHPFLWDVDGDRMPDGWELAFGYDPWDIDTDDADGTDGEDNPDEDWYAFDGTYSHHTVYLTNGFHPKTGYGYVRADGAAGPNTVAFSNYEELIGTRGFAAITENDPDDTSTHPRSNDTDGDGIWDGWEWYVGMDARDPDDAVEDYEDDDLTCFEEFESLATSTNVKAAHFPVDGWQNKTHPTDPFDSDTDGDQLFDGLERAQFNYSIAFSTQQVGVVSNDAAAEVVVDNREGGKWPGGGLNPTTVDTDGDHLPDAWEAVYAGAIDPVAGKLSGGMDGTVSDAYGDPDGDGLRNYQEYMCGAVPMWQYQYNNGDAAYVPDLGLYGYDPYDWFDSEASSNEWFTAGGGLAPEEWDPANGESNDLFIIRFRFLSARAYKELEFFRFSTCDPGDTDTDADGMDDYWEIYHGLNPLWGYLDIVASKSYGGSYVTGGESHDENGWPVADPPDYRRYPWLAGGPFADPDQDQIPNIFEAVQLRVPAPPYYHTDPSPLWMTDTTAPESWVNQHYWLGDTFGAGEWFWRGEFFYPPSYLFSFEVNEGFDTDNDNIADHAELVDEPGISPGVTDPLESQSPIRRRALYCDGQAAARTLTSFGLEITEFRTFTVEAWVRPEQPVAGQQQIVVERPMIYKQGNPMGDGEALRVNFRIGIDANGRPFAGYHGAGADVMFREAKAAPQGVLEANKWVHLACTYGGDYTVAGQWVGMLTLYVNGVVAAAVPSSEIPANGWVGSLDGDLFDDTWYDRGSFYPAPIVVGAGDDNPDGWAHKATSLVGYHTGNSHSPPELRDHFLGWIDQVHIWDGARSQSNIVDTMYKRYTRSEIQSMLSATPAVRYAFSFDDLPDPDHSPVAPAGFNALVHRPDGYPSVRWWGQADDRSTVYTDYRYVPWIDNLAGHAPMDPPFDSIRPSTNLWDYPNTSNPYTFIYEHAAYMVGEHHPDWDPPYTSGDTVPGDSSIWLWDNDGIYPDMLPLGSAAGDEDVPMWDDGGLGTDPYDTDGDQLPDTWEEQHGMDPRDPSGRHGANADLDDDGLTNLEEYFAGTNPNMVDTAGDGFGDFDSRASDNSPTWGELYSDGDGMPDAWEAMYNMRAGNTGKRGPDPAKYDPHLDPDEDGWSNLAEYRGSYYSNGVAIRSSSPIDPTTFPEPTVAIRLRYHGTLGDSIEDAIGGSPVRVAFYDKPERDGFPVATISLSEGYVTTHAFDTGHLVEGTNYGFAFLDLNGDGQWNNDWSNPLNNEPSAVCEAEVGYADGALFEFGLVEEQRGYWRFGWAPVTNATGYLVEVYSGTTLIVSREIAGGDRTYFHEGDYRAAGQLGLAPNDYYCLIWSTTDYYGTLVEIPGDPLWRKMVQGVESAPPVFVTPHGVQGFVYAQNEIRWTMDSNATSYRLEIATTNSTGGVGALITSTTDLAPWADKDGVRRALLPFRGGDAGPVGTVWENGSYWMRLQALGNGSASAQTPWQSFQLNIAEPEVGGKSLIEGDLFYFGKVHAGYKESPRYLAGETNMVLIVQTYPNASFAGESDAQVQVEVPFTGVAGTGFKGVYELMGLHNATHYVRAFIDLNGNRELDPFEPVGEKRTGIWSTGYDLEGIPIDESVGKRVSNIRIILRDRDIDCDALPDGWEYSNYGTLAYGPGDDPDGNGASSMQDYLNTVLASDPSDPDADGDGLLDILEISMGLSNQHSDTDGDGLSDKFEVDSLLDGLDPLADADQDGMLDSHEVLIAKTDPLNSADVLRLSVARNDPLNSAELLGLSDAYASGPEASAIQLMWLGKIGVVYVVEGSADLKSWQDVEVMRGDGRVLTYTQSSPSVNRFFRIVIR